MKCSELIRKLERAGWYSDRQKGSHLIMKHPKKEGFIVVPNHGSQEVGKGFEHTIKRQAGLK
jgi:mRNA interferase HicA